MDLLDGDISNTGAGLYYAIYSKLHLLPLSAISNARTLNGAVIDLDRLLGIKKRLALWILAILAGVGLRSSGGLKITWPSLIFLSVAIWSEWRGLSIRGDFCMTRPDFVDY